MGELRERADTKLATVTEIDMNTVATTDLFTVPAGKSCVITHIVIRNASITLNTASFGFGFNANADDVVAAAVLGGNLSAAAKYRVLEATDGAVRGAATDVLKIGVDTVQGAAATMDVDVFGYLF